MTHLAACRSGATIDISGTQSVANLIAAGLMFAGTPDQVYEQIVDFDRACGGFDNLLLMMQAGELSREDTADSMTLFAREVLPRLRDCAAARGADRPSNAAA